MNREILFRAKRADNGEWVEGDLISSGGYRYIRTNSGVTIMSTELAKVNPDFVGFYAHRVNPSTAGQFTGLTDKNGVKIFEGDILHESFLQTNLVGDIRLIDGCFDFIFKRDGREIREYLKCLTCNHCIEMIGNIHDNPELLEGNTI